jgi:peptidyl-tRNA hydrolase, PTH1 family
VSFLIAGLGNIGPEYELTRHNAGFLAADQLADKFKGSFTMERLAFKAEIKHKGKAIHIIKPTTYMNLSGKAINYWLKELKIPISNLLVIVDDVALPYGKIRIRPKGSSAGHNGLKSIEEVLGTQDYPRLKFGVGNDYPKGRQVEYVLGNFKKQEMEDLNLNLQRAVDAAISFCLAGVEKTMSQYNE